MNVRDFDEANDLLIANDFQYTQCGRMTHTGTSKATLMVSPVEIVEK